MNKTLENKVIKALTDSYFCNYYIDLRTNKFFSYRDITIFKKLFGSEGDATKSMNYFCENKVSFEYKDEMIKFTDLKSLPQRLKDNKYISCEYISIVYGWCCAEFYTVDYDQQGNVNSVIFIIKVIDKEKRKEIIDRNESKRRMQIIDTLAENYYLISFVDLVSYKFNFLTKNQFLNSAIENITDTRDIFKIIINDFIEEEYKDLVRDFLNVDTMMEKLIKNNNLSIEYKDIFTGWCSLEISIASRDDNGVPSSALIISKVIEKRKKFEENLNNIISARHKVLLDSNKNYEYIAKHDALTGLLNRQAYEEVTQTIKNNKSIIFILLDIDYFKLINDNEGHDVGDKILIKLGNILKSCFTTSDYIFRIGGDEFAIIVRNIAYFDELVLKAKLDLINKKFSNSNDGLPSATCSIGVCFSNKGFNENVFKNADKAVYISKKSDHSKFTIYKEENTIKEELLLNTKRSFFTEEIYSFENDNAMLIRNQHDLIEELLEGNKAVGMAILRLNDGFSIYCVSKFAVISLGYDISKVITVTNKNFINLIHIDDQDYFTENLNKKCFGKMKVRLMTKENRASWNSIYFKRFRIFDSDFCMITIREINDVLLAELCENDFTLVGILDCKNREYTIEKNNFKTKAKFYHPYNYDDLLLHTVANNIVDEDKENAYHNNTIEVILDHLNKEDIYETILYHKSNDGNAIAYRHKYRYLDKERKIVINTMENIALWAEIDSVTGLFNDFGYKRHVRTFLNTNNKGNYTLLYYDVKGFRALCDIFGIENGNLILKLIGEKISSFPFNPIFSARISDDRYSCITRSSDITENMILNSCNIKILLNNKEVSIKLNCGVYTITIDNNNLDIYSMVERARLALTNVTNDLYKPYCYYSEQMNQQYVDNVTIADMLAIGLKHSEFKVYYQPIIDVKTKEIVSAEALVRWLHPQKGLISPNNFIPVLEKNGYISDLDLFIEKNVLKFLDDRKIMNKKIVPISMNLSRVDFMNNAMILELLDRLEKSNVSNEYLKYEVTESAFINIDINGKNALDNLRESGSQILLDDFGTGYSSLSSISDQNFDVIKLDIAFIKKIGVNKKNEAVIITTINLAHELGCKIVAEGVETKEQFEFLLQNNCDYVQGYYFYKPMNQYDFEKLLDK